MQPLLENSGTEEESVESKISFMFLCRMYLKTFYADGSCTGVKQRTINWRKNREACIKQL